ncbi:hypothetical protein DFH94DRAFT_119168 [Russula ochroleuca]|uniref:Uncharacterized protein n=1 Tax=Russula ochroleuca TaxID=152965 RepID=A0A9P5MRG4_9AGAM|nr:hypothetical protein DFH94DRAFT_119168 [Russula ochroleuca]
MTTHTPWPPFPGPSLRFAFLLCLNHLLCVLAHHDQIVIENTDPSISYLPSVCNSTGTLASSTCTAPWQVVSFTAATSGTVTSTFGPTSVGGNLIPQLFLVLRGTSFVLTTSSVSNATANVTVLASPSNVFVSTTFDSSAGSISTVGLPSDQDVTLALTYIQSPNGEPTRLDIDSIVVFGVDPRQTSLTPTPLPSSSSLPSFIVPAPSTTTSTVRPHSSLAQSKGTIMETL